MNVHISTLSDYKILSIEGRLDAITSAEFEIKLMETIENGSIKVIIDCNDLTYISSSGLRVFLLGQKKILSKNGELKICNLQALIKEIFDISGFSTIFSIHPDLEKAIKA